MADAANRRRRIAKIRPQGLNRDESPGLLLGAAYSDMANVIWRDNGAMPPSEDLLINSGWTLGAKPSVPLYIVQPRSSSFNYWLMIGNDGGGPAAAEVIAYRGDSSKNITPAGMAVASANEFTGGNIQGLPFFCDGANTFYWGLDYATPTAMAAIPGDPGAYSMRAYDDFLIAMNTGGFQDQIRWSDRAAPGAIPATWTATATNEAGSATIGDTPGPIIDGRALGGSFMIYKQNSAYIMTEQGLPEVMGVRKVFDTVGVMSRNCVQEYQNNHFLVTPDDVIQHDGRSARSLMSGSIRRWFNGEIDLIRRNETYCAWNSPYKELWVCFPSRGSGKDYCDLALVYDGNGWGVREIGDDDRYATGDGDEGWPYMQIGRGASTSPTDAEPQFLFAPNPSATSQDNKLAYLDGGGRPNDGCTVTVEGIELNNGGWADIRKIWPIGKNLEKGAGGSAGAAMVELGTADNVNGPYTYDAAVAVYDGNGNPASVKGRGKYHAIRFAFPHGSISGQDPRLNGFDVEYVTRGRD